jgi:hypothetical protein
MNNTSSWRQIQIQAHHAGFVIPQEKRLLDFVQEKHITSLVLSGDSELAYLKTALVNCKFDALDPGGLLVIVANQLGMKLEHILSNVAVDILTHYPDWIYIAINKYLVTTDKTWPKLTPDYDQDLMNITADFITNMGYAEISRHNILDLGNSYNFVHPTTNMYFGKNK